MGVSCEQFVGYTLTVKTKLNSQDFEHFEQFLRNHPEYGTLAENKIALIVDGMNGLYARLVYIDNRVSGLQVVDDDTDYTALNTVEAPDAVYDEIQKAYNLLYAEPLSNPLKIEYAVWLHYS